MKPKKPLTPRSIEALKAAPEGKRVLIWDATVQGFAVRVTDTGSKSFVLVTRYPGDKHPTPRAIGTVGAISLAKARDKAKEWLEAIADGLDPRTIAEAAAANTLRAVAESYLAREAKNLRSAGQKQDHFERQIFPSLGNRPVGEIRRSEIIAMLDKIEDTAGPVQADRVLATLRKLFNWHASRDDEFRSPIVKGMMRTKPKERARKRTLADDELRIVWKVADQHTCPYDYMLQFILLTATRRSEASDMNESEMTGVDWVIPAERYKTKLDHLVPLSEKAQVLLSAVPRRNGWLFTTTGNFPVSGFSKFKREFDARVTKANGKRLENWTTHDLRRTARTLMSRAGVDADIAERCLGHTLPTIRGTYDLWEYRDEKAQAFEALASLIDRIVKPQANVIPLRAAHE
jgi:integrase